MENKNGKWRKKKERMKEFIVNDKKIIVSDKGVIFDGDGKCTRYLFKKYPAIRLKEKHIHFIKDDGIINFINFTSINSDEKIAEIYNCIVEMYMKTIHSNKIEKIDKYKEFIKECVEQSVQNLALTPVLGCEYKHLQSSNMSKGMNP